MIRNMNEWVSEIINDPKRRAMPIMTHPGIESCGCHVLDAVTDGKVHFNAVRALSERWPTVASTVIMDLTVEAEAFGSVITFHENEVPSVKDNLVSDYESVNQLAVPDLTQGRVPQYLLANQLSARHITDRPVLAGCIGPFSLAGRLLGMTEAMTAIYIEPETIRLLLEKCTTFLMDYCHALKNTGVNGIVLAEPAAGLLSNEDCMSCSTIYIKQLVDALQDSSFLFVLHNCGNTGHATEAMVKSGVAALHFGNKISMREALQQCPADRLVMGNIDPVNDFKLSSPADLYRTTRHLLEETVSWNNFVLSTGCDVPPNVPQENISAFFTALDDFNHERRK